MKYTSKTLPKSQAELVVTVSPEDYKKDLQKAAVSLSERASIKGFRPGKAPYETVKQNLGELKIMQEAMQTIVESNYTKAVKEAKLETVGMPQITIDKMAPDNDFIFKATVALLPTIKIGALDKINISKKNIGVDDKKVDETLEHLTKMQAKEVIKPAKSKASKNDKVTIDMNMSINKVPVDGGQAKNHGVYLSEQHYIPGLQDKLIGLEKGEEKEFNLKFPKEHYQKHLAGKNIDFKIKVNDVYTIEYPELTDDFAKSLGVDGLDKLKETLKENLQKEEDKKEDQRLEIEMFEKLIENSEIGEVPDVLVDHEKHKMFHELKERLSQQGIAIEKYLQDLKKTEKEIQDDFAEQALKRVKSAMISRQIALDNNLKADEKELEEEIKLIKKAYPNDKNVAENLKRPEVLDTLRTAIQNRKVIKWLKNKLVKQ